MPLVPFLHVDISQQAQGVIDVPDSTGHTMKLYVQQGKPYLFSTSTVNRHLIENISFFQEQPKDLLKKKIKVVFIYRNPKDLVVSYFHHVQRLSLFYQFTGDFSSFLVRFAEGLLDNNSFFEYLKSWETGIRDNPELKVCILSYEDLQDDSMRHLQRLAQFLEKDCTDDFLASVIKATSFDAMKTAKGDLLSDTSGSIMYRKGKVGDWKDHFTEAQNIWFDHIIRTHMGRSGSLFPFRYSL